MKSNARTWTIGALISLVSGAALADVVPPTEEQSRSTRRFEDLEVTDLTVGPSIGGSIGVFFSEPKELNAYLKGLTLNGDAVAGEITWMTALTGSLDYALSRYWSVGARFQYADIRDYRKVSLNDVSQSIAAELSWLLPLVTTEVRYPIAERVSVGVSGGAGTPVFYRLGLEDTLSDGSGSKSGKATYEGRPFAAFAALSASLAFSRRAILRLEGGYQWLDAAKVTAAEAGQGREGGVREGSVLRSGGEALPVNAGAPYLSVGFAWIL